MKKERKVKASYRLGKRNAARSKKRDAKHRFEDTQLGADLDFMLTGELPSKQRGVTDGLT